jgi:hypothetical protein
MPAQPTWFHRLEEILAELRALDTVYLDRLAVEQMFGVRERRARQIMGGLPCLQIGNAVAVERVALIRRLEGVAAGDDFEREVSRRTRVAESLEVLRKHATARCVRVPIAADAHERTFSDLAPGIQLGPGELRIQFHGAEDLAAKLFELSQAMANDWDSLVRRLTPDPVVPIC